jgi:FkbM family methyltransferase
MDRPLTSSGVRDSGSASRAKAILRGPLRKLVPRPLRRGLVSVTQYPDTWRLVADWRSFREFRRLENPPRRLLESGDTVRVRFRQLGGVTVHLRPQTEDDGLARDVFFRSHHLPPRSMDASKVRIIWDLGANIGLTMVHMAVLFPRAHIVGVELDGDNAALCRENVSSWPDRCEVVHAGVWIADGTVGYERPAGRAQSFHIADGAPAASQAPVPNAPAISLNSLLRQNGEGATDHVDYVKMDIEGAERLVLKQNTEWAAHVRSIKVEVHRGYGVDECIEDLARLGFRAEPIANHRAGVTGIRPG